MDQMKHLYVKVSDYISGVKDLKDLDSTLRDLTRSRAGDTFQRVKNIVRIQDDWITYIESKMKYVEAAVYENRQFISDDGEVLPIERVKKISRTSVEHLARHSDFIQKYNEEDGVTPSKLYTVNKETDYGVYENKFLYLLLTTINDFITRESDDITKSLKGDNGEFSIIRQNTFGLDEIELELKMSFREAEAGNTLVESERKKIMRMDELKGRAEALLQTPLMQILSREPLISSTITKTNVLTMNENFSNSLELYEYLINYEAQSFVIEKQKQSLSLRSEFSFPLLALELLVQGFKDDIMEDYERGFNEIKSILRQQEIAALEERIQGIKEKYQEDPTSYILLLEDKLNILGEQNKEIDILKHDLQVLERHKITLEDEKKELLSKMESMEEKVNELLDRIKGFEKEKLELRNSYEGKLLGKDKEYQKLKEQFDVSVESLAKAEKEKFDLSSRTRKLEESLKETKEEHQEAIDNFQKEISMKNEKITSLEEELNLLKAQFTAIQVSAGTLTVESAKTDKESFDELEKEYNTFTQYFESVWDKTQIEIKKEVKKEIKRKKG